MKFITTTSRFAIATAAGLFMGGIALTPAQAADLGGDCCADLEERVAELEATTVRKGNRKVSVKISGQVNYVMLYWDDGGKTDVYIGDNIESSTRFRFTGAAKFRPGWSAGFLLEVQTFSATSSGFSQVNDGSGRDNADGILSMRKAAWYLKSDRLGEVWMGRYSPATDDIKLLNIAGTPHVDASNEIGNGFFLRAPSGTGGCQGSGCLYALTLGAISPGGDTRRGEVIRYNTPSLMGLVFSVSWGEDDIFDVAVRYKKQWNSIRVVGGIGYHWDTDEDNDVNQLTCAGFDPRFGAAGVAVPGSNGAIQNTSINNPGIPGSGVAVLQANTLNAACRDAHFDLERLAGSFSAMHTPSGLYAYFGGHRDSWGSFSSYDDSGNPAGVNIEGLRTGGGPTEADDTTHWYVQLGIKRRIGPMRNLGATTAYVEYQQWDDALAGTTSGSVGFLGNNAFGPNHATAAGTAAGAGNLALLNLAAAAAGLATYTGNTVEGLAGFRTANGTYITDSSVDSWGFGVVQNIDKAAMQLWLGFRKFEPEVRTNTVLNAGIETCVAGTGVGVNACPASGIHPQQLATQSINVKHRIEDIWLISAGGKLKF